MSKVVRFPQPAEAPDTLENMVERIQKLAQDSGCVFWDNNHVQLRMRERNVTIRQILDVLRHGRGVDGPNLDQYGDWRIKLKRYTAGRSVQVVVVVREEHLEVVTVI